jgi:uncharacterized protein (TIGR03435 family)
VSAHAQETPCKPLPTPDSRRPADLSRVRTQQGRKGSEVAYSDPEFDTGSIYVKDLAAGQTAAPVVGHSMPMFADILMNFIQDRQIVDETGLTGHFEFTITVPTSDLRGDPVCGPADDRADAFRRALQPLGFKLVP